MFDRSEADLKFSHVYQDRTAAQFGQTHEQGLAGQVEAEKLYVERLKSQRGKIQTLYSKYDSLFKDLKNKESQIKEKDKAISNLEQKCKKLSVVNQESNVFRQHSKDVKTENVTLQRAISELEQSYIFLNGQFRTKDVVSSQKFEQMETLNEELMSKLRLLSKKYQEKQDQFGQKIKCMQAKYQEAVIEGRREKQEHIEDEELLKNSILQKDEQIRLLKTQNQCLKERVSQLQAYVNELIYQSQLKLQESQKEKKAQTKLLKNQIQALRQTNHTLQRKWQKLKDEFQVKENSLGEMTLVIQHHEKQSNEAFSQIKQQYASERSQLKEQLIQYENHIAKLERKLTDCLRKEQYYFAKIKKYQGCMNAKRNLREVEREELEKINMILNLP